MVTAVRTIVPHIVGGECAFDMQFSGWANVLRAGGLNQRHLHRGNHVSLVYYVETGGVADAQVDPDIPETSGALELMDPRGHFEMATLREDPLGRNLIIRPENGRLVAFPSWLYHQVTPYQGEGERISIAVNVQISNVMRATAGDAGR